MNLVVLIATREPDPKTHNNITALKNKKTINKFQIKWKVKKMCFAVLTNYCQKQKPEI